MTIREGLAAVCFAVVMAELFATFYWILP